MSFFTTFLTSKIDCPLSSVLFVLCVELLAHLNRHSSDVNGINIGDTEVLLTQFADDMSCFVNDENSIRQIFSICDEFYYTSGLALNAEKSTILRLGNWKQKKYTLCGAAMCDDKYNLLGFTLSRDVTSTALLER